MPAYNFSSEFAPLVGSGEKTQTIRKRRKRPIQVGDTLYLYTGMRTKQCRKLGEATCTAVETIKIYPTQQIILGKQILRFSGRWKLAKADGFTGLRDFYAFFRDHYGLPFTGILIKWEASKKSCNHSAHNWNLQEDGTWICRGCGEVMKEAREGPLPSRMKGDA